LFSIDTAFHPLKDEEVTGELIEVRISSMSFKNFDFLEKKVSFVLECVTEKPYFWKLLSSSAEKIFFCKKESSTILYFNQTVDCGYIKLYRFRPSANALLYLDETVHASEILSEEYLYNLIDTESARYVFKAWNEHKERVTSLPTEFVEGRMKNTSVEKAMIFSKGDGCVVCGDVAQCYAATTVGDLNSAFIMKLPVCKEHLDEARKFPSNFSFLASLFSLNMDLDDVYKSHKIDDELIPLVHETIASELNGSIGMSKKTQRGWELWINLSSGWKWLLRLGSFTDYAYVLFEPNVKKERYRADSAPDHPDVKFFPMHEHSSPNRKSDIVSPSFLYGHPFFDLKRLRDVGNDLGA